MTSPLPVQVTLPVIAVAVVVTFARCRLLRDSPADRLINRSLIWVLVGLVLHPRHLAPTPEYRSLMHQLGLGASLAILSGTFGLTRLWTGVDPRTARPRQRRYDLVVVISFAVMFLAGTPARDAGLLIDQAVGPLVIVFWTAFGLPHAIASGAILYICVRESRAEKLSPREKFVYAVVFIAAGAIFLDVLTQPVVAALCTYADFTIVDDQMVRKAATFYATAFAATSVSALSVLRLFAARMQWDRDGRRARRLVPLWSDLAAAFPQLSLYTADELARQPAAHRMHRMSIEIHDVLLRLRAHMPAAAPPVTDDLDTRIQHYAGVVARAATTMKAGAAPDIGAIPHAPRIPTGPSDLDVLLALARHFAACSALDRRPTDDRAFDGGDGPPAGFGVVVVGDLDWSRFSSSNNYRHLSGESAPATGSM